MPKDQNNKDNYAPATESTTIEINSRFELKNYSAQPNTKNTSGNQPKSISDKLNQTNNSERNNNE